jgi:hypothetical protein
MLHLTEIMLGKPVTLQLEEKSVDKTISGKIVDDTNSPLPGVSIVLKGTQRGTVTDGNGLYKLEVPDNATLIFSFVGYLPQEVVVGNQTAINLTLRPDSKVLEEIVVIGYGTLKKSDLTGSVATVKADQLNGTSRAFTCATTIWQNGRSTSKYQLRPPRG